MVRNTSYLDDQIGSATGRKDLLCCMYAAWIFRIPCELFETIDIGTNPLRTPKIVARGQHRTKFINDFNGKRMVPRGGLPVLLRIKGLALGGTSRLPN